MDSQPLSETQPPVYARAIPVARAARTGPLAWAPLAHLTTREARLDLALIVMVLVVLEYSPQLLMATSLLDAMPDLADAEARARWFFMLLTHIFSKLALATTLLLYLAARHAGLADLGVSLRKPLVQGMWALLSYGACYVGMLAALPLSVCFVLLSPDAQEQIGQRMDFMNSIPHEDWSLLLPFMFAVGFQEEMVFRALLLPYLRRICGSWTAALAVVSGAFAVLHVPGQGWSGAIVVSGVGLALGVMFILSRSLLAVGLAHMAFNVTQASLFSLMRPDQFDLDF